MAELKPCPFCGSKPEIKTFKRAKIISCSAFSTDPNTCITKKLHSQYYVNCTNKKCNCRPLTRFFYTKKKSNRGMEHTSKRERRCGVVRYIKCVSCDHKYCEFCNAGDKYQKKVKAKGVTHFDRIKAMSVEEMAEDLTKLFYEVVSYTNAKDYIKQYLESEVQNSEYSDRND